MFFGKPVADSVVLRSTLNGGDRIGIGVINKTLQSDRISGPESFPFFSVCVVARGEGSYEDCATGKRYPLSEGMFFMRQPGVEHIIRIDPDSGWLEFFINVGNFSWLFFKNHFNLSEDTPVGEFAPGEEWWREFCEMRDALQGCSISELPEMFLRLSSLVFQCLRGISYRNKAEGMVHEACVFLCSDFSQRKDIKQFCRKKGWGYDNFRKMFKRQMGMAPNQYRIQRRMDAACAYLMQRELNIEAIATLLGYCTSYEFSAKFKMFFGHSPSAFRKQQTHNSYLGNETIQAKVGNAFPTQMRGAM